MGRAIAEVPGRRGGQGRRAGHGADTLDATVAALAEQGSPDPVGLSVDVSDAGRVNEVFGELGDRWGSLNVLVNTIGPAAGRFEQLDDAGWDTAFDPGTMAAVRCVRAALPLMRAAEWRRIVNLSAHSPQRQSPLLVAYTASKAALTSVSKNLAKSFAPEGILVNTVSPGSIVTASFSEGLRGMFEAEGLDPTDPYDVMRWIHHHFHQPADLAGPGCPRRWPPWSPSWLHGPMATSRAPTSTLMVDRISSEPPVR